MSETEKSIIIERYRLALYHEIKDSDGIWKMIDPPLVTMMNFELGIAERYGSVVFINQMLDKLKYAMLEKLGGEGKRWEIC